MQRFNKTDRFKFYHLFFLFLLSLNLLAQSKTTKPIELPLKNFNTEFLPFTFDSTILNEIIYIDYHSGSAPIKINGCVYLNPGEELKQINPRLPLAFKYYQGIFEAAYINRYGVSYINKVLKSDLSEYFQPFYIKQHEVTNAEYREFVYWVRDSIARSILAEHFPDEFLLEEYDEFGELLPESERSLNWEKEFDYWDQKYRPLLEKMYYPTNERYYIKKEFDIRRFLYNYRVFDSKAYAKELKNHRDTSSKIDINNFDIKYILNVYPDTLCWNTHFPNQEFDLLKNMYFWHPAFDQHPVVGVTFDQAQAFCDWKTKQLNKLNSKKGIKLEVLLPTEYEWEYAVEKTYSKSKTYLELLYNKDQTQELALLLEPFYDVNFLINTEKTDLGLKNADDSANYVFNKIARNFIVLNQNKAINLIEELNSIGLFAYDKKLNATEIYGLNNNVSEWMNETCIGINTVPNYSKNYFFMLEPAISEHVLFENEISEDKRKSIYRLRLVRGANWFDDYNTLYLKNNPQGTKAKTLAVNDSSYSTLGFRYVVRIK